jgi:hypothetical protein
MGWIHLTQDREQWKALVKMIIKLRVSKMLVIIIRKLSSTQIRNFRTH